MKWLLRIVVAVVLLVVLAMVAAVVFIDPVAKGAVEKGGTYALGVDTTVQKMSIGLTSGNVKMDGLRVANPEGFSSDPLLKTDSFSVSVRPMSLMGQTVEVRTFVIDGLEVSVEQKGTATNITKIMDHLKSLSGSSSSSSGGEQAKPKGAPEEGKKLAVTNITIKNAKATFRIGLVGGKPIVVPIPTIELKNVTNDNAKGLAVHELVARVVPAILAAALDAAKGAVDARFLGDMNGQLKGVAAALGGNVGDLMGQAGTQFSDLLGKTLGTTQPADLIKKIPGGLPKIPDKLPGNLLPGH